MKKQTFLQGTLMLIVAGMITRFLGFINRIVVARVMGEEGVGLYMMALPTLFLVITLTQLGLPVAISKRVAEADAKNDQAKIKSILVVSLIVTSITSIIFTIGMILVAPFIANSLLTDNRTLLPLMVISPIVPVIAISSVLKGYFQGKQNMRPQSYAQVIEQFVRITCVAFFIKLLMPYGIEYAAAGAMISVIIGEVASLLYLIYLFKHKKTVKIRTRFFSYLKSGKDTLTDLFSIALPTTGSRLIGNFSQFLEPIIVSQSLALAGVATSVATKQYGELTGYVLPLLLLPTFITYSLATALVPSISEAEANSNQQLTHYRIHQAIRISFSSGALATIVLVFFSSPILTFMYGTDNASKYVVLMAPFFILLYIQAPLQAALQALDFAKLAMWNSLIGTTCKLIVLFLLTSNPKFGIMGVAISMSVGVVLVTLLHLATLKKVINFSVGIKTFTKMVVLVILTASVGYVFQKVFIAINGNFMHLLIILFFLSILYVFFLFLLRIITKEELIHIPIINKWL